MAYFHIAWVGHGLINMARKSNGVGNMAAWCLESSTMATQNLVFNSYVHKVHACRLEQWDPQLELSYVLAAARGGHACM